MQRMLKGLGVLWGLGLVMCADATPKLVVSPETLDLGRQSERKEGYPMSYTLRNAGDSVLTITHVKPSCGCTDAQIGKRALQPGESTEVTATFRTGSYEGWQRKSIHITSNDPAAPQKAVTFRLFVPFIKQGMRLRPDYGQVIVRKVGEGFVATVGVQNCDPEGTVRITRLDVPEGWQVGTRLPIIVQAENQAWISLTGAVHAEDETGFSKRMLTMHLDHPTDKTLSAELVYRPPPRKPPGITLYPDMETFTAYPSQDWIQVNVAVENGEPKNVELLKVDLPDGWRCTITLPCTLAPQARKWLYFRRELGDNSAFTKLPFVIHTDHEKSREVKGTMGYVPRTVPSR